MNNPCAPRARVNPRSRQTSQAATAMDIYKSVHTGPNTAAGTSNCRATCSSRVTDPRM
jgi:hypothetical protein